MKLRDIIEAASLTETRHRYYVKLWGKVHDVSVSSYKIHGTDVSSLDLDDVYEQIGEDDKLRRAFEKGFEHLVNAPGDHYSVTIQEVHLKRDQSCIDADLLIETPDLDGEAPRSVKGEIHQS